MNLTVDRLLFGSPDLTDDQNNRNGKIALSVKCSFHFTIKVIKKEEKRIMK
jgi:hypothetical protein